MATNIREHHIAIPGMKVLKGALNRLSPEEKTSAGGLSLGLMSLGMIKVSDKIHQAVISAPKLTQTDIIPPGQNPLEAVFSSDFPMHLYNLLVSGLLHDTLAQGADAMKALGTAGGAVGITVGILGLLATFIKHPRS